MRSSAASGKSAASLLRTTGYKFRAITDEFDATMHIDGFAGFNAGWLDRLRKSSLMSLLRLDAKEPAGSALGSQYTSVSNWHESMLLAQRESAETGKPILADFTGSDWCHWCVKLKQDVFETEVFQNWAAENVVLLELDYPKQGTQTPEIKRQNAELAERYKIQSYPTVLLLDANGECLAKWAIKKIPRIGLNLRPHS